MSSIPLTNESFLQVCELDRTENLQFPIQAALIVNLETGHFKSGYILNSKRIKDTIFREKIFYPYLIYCSVTF